MKRKRLVIVGAGVVGLCIAYYALEKGYSVTILERGPANHDGCSLGNAGMIVPSHFIPLAAPGMVAMGLRMMGDPESPFSIRPRLDRDLFEWGWQFVRSSTDKHVTRSAPLLRDLSQASRCAYVDLAERFSGSFELVKRGLLMLCKTDEKLTEEAHLAEHANQLGVTARVLTATETAQLDPGIRMDVAGSVYFPDDCHLSPNKLMAALRNAIDSAGGEIRYATSVAGWQIESGRIQSIRTSAGDITADEFVLAAGSWSPSLLRDLNLRLPMQAGKGYSITLPHPRQKPELCSILTEARVAVTPMGDTLRIGGTMQISGMDGSVEPARVRGILKSFPRYFPEFGPDDFLTSDKDSLPVWSGLRPCSPDGLPYIGRFSRYANLIAATGHAMMGISLAPVTGQLIGAILAGEPVSHDLTALSPDRFR